MKTAREIAADFVTEHDEINDLELAILRHMEHHANLERARCAEIADHHAHPDGPGFMHDTDYREAARTIARAIRNPRGP
jgi:hypothetical protein